MTTKQEMDITQETALAFLSFVEQNYECCYSDRFSDTQFFKEREEYNQEVKFGFAIFNGDALWGAFLEAQTTEECMIRVDMQGLENIPETYVLSLIERGGVEIIKFKYSSYGACLFIHIKGNYTGEVEITKLKTPPNEFDWDI